MSPSTYPRSNVEIENPARGDKITGYLNNMMERDVFISSAYAQTAAPAGAASLLSGPMPIFILMFVVMYFLMIRPQQKRQKEQKEMMDALAKGDEVVTSGGILGKVAKVTDQYVTLEVAQGSEIVVQKGSITTLLLKGTIKSL